MELCDLYILEQDYNKAAFCCEELILHNPNNHIYFQRCIQVHLHMFLTPQFMPNVL